MDEIATAFPTAVRIFDTYKGGIIFGGCNRIRGEGHVFLLMYWGKAIYICFKVIFHHSSSPPINKNNSLKEDLKF